MEQRLIDANALFKMCEKTAWYDNADRDEVAEELILNAPTVEAVPVVRCCECKRTKTDCEGVIYCKKWDMWEMPEDAFCSYGERKEGGEHG